MATNDELTAITAANWHSFKKVMISTTTAIVIVLALMALFLL